MNNKYELLNYMPDYYEGVYEMEELLKSESLTLKDLEDRHLRTLLNEFVSTADTKGISLFESQLGIVPDENDTLEMRRNKVLMYLLPPRPITIRFFRDMLNNVNLPVKIDVNYGARAVVATAKSAEMTSNQINYLKYLLNVYLPANLLYQVKILLNTAKVSDNLNLGIGNVVKAASIAKASPSQVFN
ncbi:YmfQ family protein [Lactobacillus gasseri]|uniref:putative phage tail protein n=1 Tax=Lactobacillus gasseri TaxID=1596 RepID=UPI00210E769F|nr:putative phage tail protein [Lactobacillus gasseri]MCQ5247071.1 YmfQ family protein [Lactobacillus gasseri]